MLLGIASAEFANLGYEGTSIRHIAQLAEISLPTLYFHFGDKRALYEECCREVFAESQIATDSALRGPGTASERIHAFVVALITSMTGESRLYRLFIRELLQSDQSILAELLETQTMPSFELLRHTLEEALQRPVPIFEPIMLYSLTTGMVQFEQFGGAIADALQDLNDNPRRTASVIVARLFPELALRPGDS
ncbi:MAG: hypothetical protein CME88_03240 [Hirschia sp.]|nr:hypothetical protein [Hirschia sp.]MBF17373.1 hypothetical protein [Hirschia sp.]|tara:strand:- start:190 stop:768 length:579 start_codon:yes stop_codon:yes gene_type:complete